MILYFCNHLQFIVTNKKLLCNETLGIIWYKLIILRKMDVSFMRIIKKLCAFTLSLCVFSACSFAILGKNSIYSEEGSSQIYAYEKNNNNICENSWQPKAIRQKKLRQNFSKSNKNSDNFIFPVQTFFTCNFYNYMLIYT